MAKKLTSALGIDIGSSNIKVAEVRLQGKTPVVTALGSAPTPEGAVDHIGIHDVDSVAATLKALFTSTGASVPDAVVSIAGQGSVLVRTVEVPAMNESELKQHMDWEITRNIPFAESTVVSDFKAFPPEAANPQNMDVVMAISPQSAVDQIVNIIKKAGRKPGAIDVEPLGIARTLAIGYADDYPGESICVVDVGHKTTSINVYKDGKLLMPRQVPIGGEMITRSVADSLGIGFQEAEEMKERATITENFGAAAVFNPFDASASAGETQAFTPYNPFAEPVEEATAAPVEAEPDLPVAAPVPTPVPDANDDRVANAMAPVLDEFVAEVRRSVDYFRSKGGEVHRILVCGGGSHMTGLPSFLERSLGMPCALLDPLRNVNLNAKRLEPGTESGSRSEFAVAIGNGLYVCF
ncbi:MAG: type IV pilus assembly protein PilM [Fimbriimonadaceae bacterium]|nr:type IV pilus assembly protein PilM [Fimbriimonadaceae bacterium]QYK55860.1 MAG: type IV pilus assembly protein PilM [Fimbriimonadaceae bacterium]